MGLIAHWFCILYKYKYNAKCEVQMVIQSQNAKVGKCGYRTDFG